MLRWVMQVTSLPVSDLLPYPESLTVLRDSFLNHKTAITGIKANIAFFVISGQGLKGCSQFRSSFQ